MSETSLFWTDATGDGGPYDQTELGVWMEHLFTTDNDDTEGVLKGDGGELAVSGAATPLSVASGAAIVKGRFYLSTAAEAVAIASPAAATRIDRVVLQANWTTQTVRIALIAGVEGGAAPALTQTDGTEWEIPLAQASITTGGVVTLTDERTFCQFGTRVSTAMIDADAVTNAKIADDQIDSEHYVDGSIDHAHLSADCVNGDNIADNALDSEHYVDLSIDTVHLANAAVTAGKLANNSVTNAKMDDDAINTLEIVDGAVTAAKIANRTRKLWIPATSGRDSTSGAPIVQQGYGLAFAFDHLAETAMVFQVPQDYASGGTVRMYFFTLATGVIRLIRDTWIAAAGEAYNNYHAAASASDHTVTVANVIETDAAVDISALIAVGDFVTWDWWRDGPHANDVNAGNTQVLGLEFEYTADS